MISKALTAAKYLAMVAAVTALAACDSGRSDARSTADDPPVVPESSSPAPAVTDEMRQAEADAQRSITESENELGAFLAERLPPGQLPAGEWDEIDGARVCRGFLTRFENHDYCAAEVPSDWRPFEFDGRTYYVQPLSDVPAQR